MLIKVELSVAERYELWRTFNEFHRGYKANI